MTDFNSLRSINFDFIISSRLGNKAYILPVDNDTIMIFLGRMKDCDLKMYLSSINLIGAKSDGLSKEDMGRLLVSCHYAKALINNESEFLTKSILKTVYKEIEDELEKVKLTLTILSPQEDPNIRKSQESELKKQEALQNAYETELIYIKEKINGKGISDDTLKDIAESKETVKRNDDTLPEEFIPIIETIPSANAYIPIESFPKDIDDNKDATIKEKSNENTEEVLIEREETDRDLDLKSIESRELSKTKAGEILYYERNLKFTESSLSKDLPIFSFLKLSEKNNTSYFFGLTKNIEKHTYNNKDESLYELTKADETFYLLATKDFIKNDIHEILDTEFRASFSMYYDFITEIFNKYMGNLLSIKEYQDFKSYINAIGDIFCSFIHNEKRKIYEADLMAYNLLFYSEIYGNIIHKPKEDVAKDILDNNKEDYIKIYEDILSNHVASNDTRDFISSLLEQLVEFPKDFSVIYPSIPEKRRHPFIDESFLKELPFNKITFKILLFNDNDDGYDSKEYKNVPVFEVLSDFLKFKSYKKFLCMTDLGDRVRLFKSINNETPIPIFKMDKLASLQGKDEFIGLIRLFYEAIKKALLITEDFHEKA